MLSAISLSPFLPTPNTRLPVIVEGRCQLEEAAEDYLFQITVNFEGRCAFQGALHANDQVKTCRVELQFPLFSKRRLAKALQKKRFQVRLIQSGTKDELILLLFCEKLMKDARKYVTEFNKENILESSHPSLINREVHCLAEDREVKQGFLLFLIKCSGRNRNEKEPYFREFSAEVLKGTPYASINAVATLIRMQYSFYDEDLREVNLFQANLEEGMFYKAKLNRANLERTRLHNACLHDADLKEAKMSQVDTGRKPSILTSSEIESWDTSPNERLLAVANQAGVSIWDLEQDVLHISIKLETIIEKHLKCPYASLTSPSNRKRFDPFFFFRSWNIDRIKFIDDHRILVLDQVGFLGLWSIADSTLLSAIPTIRALIHYRYLPLSVSDEILKVYKGTVSKQSFSSKLQNFYCYKKSFNPLQKDSVNTYFFLINYADRLGSFYSKSIIQTSKILENRIKISGKSLSSSFKDEAGDSQVQGVYTYGNNKTCLCFSPSGWIAGVTNKQGQTILEIKSTRGHQTVSFLTGEEICKLNFTADDLWLIGLIKTPSTSKLVGWRTDKIFPQTDLPQVVLPIPEYKELFQIIGNIDQFELLSNMSYCVYAFDSVIQVKNLNTHKIIYNTEIKPPYTFKLLSREGLLLTLKNSKSYFEVRKVDLASSEFLQPAYWGFQYVSFTPDSRYLITCPPDKSGKECLKEEEIRSQIPYEARSYLLNMIKQTEAIPEIDNYCVRVFPSPLFKYAVLINSHTFRIWNIEKSQEVNLAQQEYGDLLDLLRNYFLEDKNCTNIDFARDVPGYLSDDLFLSMVHDKQMIVIDLRDSQSPQIVLKVRAAYSIRQMRLSKDPLHQSKALFYTSKNEIISSYCNVEKAPLSFKGHTRDIIDFDISYDNGVLISSGEDLTLRLWDISTGEQLDYVETHDVYSNLMFAPTHRIIATCFQQEDRGYLWEVKDSKLRLLSIYPKELGCGRANFENVMDMDEGNKKLFKQLGGQNIRK